MAEAGLVSALMKPIQWGPRPLRRLGPPPVDARDAL